MTTGYTNLTDGLASLDEMVAAAARRGYRYCAITDHAPLLAMQRMTRDKARCPWPCHTWPTSVTVPQSPSVAGFRPTR